MAPMSTRTTETKPPTPAKDHTVPSPTCSTRLTELKSKVIGTKCGSYMSCADFY